MGEKGAWAAFVLHGVVGSCGTLLVGKKARGFSLDPLDVDFLESLARSLGPLVESHLQSLELTLRLEEVERAKRELEESDRFKTDIINVISHEFRTPVTVLYGFTTTLGRRMEEMGREGMREGLAHIEAAAARLKQVLDKFLTVSLLRSGKEKPVPVPCGVAEFLERVLSSISEEERKRLRVEGGAEGLFLATDPHLLSLVLENLLENAFRFSDDFSPVTLRVAEEQGAVLLSVEDRGEGIEPEKLELLFFPFTRLEEADKHGKGTGLGLYIVRMCADLLGLDVRVDSAPGRGSRFAVRVPGGRVSLHDEPPAFPRVNPERDAS
jgi:signal transduction histidine kinase